MLGFAGAASPGYAQETTDIAPPAPEVGAGPEDEIVVTGTLFRTQVTPSPVTVVTSDDLDRRGINTVQDAIQQLTSNNGPALTNSFTANGAFAAGASAASLRGLSTNSTLVLFDGQRAAYYPLADDGSRNFVDLNTIPDDIIERIEVLRDGASSTYGADAIAGVINIITRREFQGVRARGEAGISQDGDAANYRLSLTAGIGDLASQGFNAYLSGFYYRSEAVYNRELPYPFNTDDQTAICFEGECGPNNIVNSRDPESGQLEGFLVGYDVYVRPYTGTNATIPGSRYELLNPAAGCQYGPGYNLTPEEIANAANAVAPINTPVCTVDITNRYGVVAPNIERFGGSGRFTVQVGDSSEAYLMVNFQQSTVNFTGAPPVFRGQANAGILFRPFSTAAGPSAALAPGSFALTLPVYVCPNGVGDARGTNTGCDATNGVLNPNNPFAAQGQVARILGRPIQDPVYNETRSRVYRAAFGISGTLWDNWDYSVEATAMHNDLRRLQQGYVYIANMLTAIAQGTFNFVNPELNDQDILDFVSPDNVTNASSDLYAAQVNLSTALADLPGGPLELGFGAQIRYEAVDAPSANPDTDGPTQRYFTLNAFGTSGNRTVYSAFAEVNAPIIEQVEVNVSGRYDRYSSGQDSFSPKAGIIFRPIPEITLRGTYSRGFRIPSFGEANALPTTGFVTVSTSTLPNSFLSQYGPDCRSDNPDGCPAYITNYSRGLTTLASPDLEPEKSRSFTLGAIFRPIPNVTLSVDYYNIRKTGAITSAPIGPALDAYFAGQPIPDGYNVIPDAPDPNFPDALPRPAFVESQLVNANTIKSEGLDFAANANFELAPGLRWRTNAEASYILELSTTFPDGTKQDYEGTLGNFALTAGSGTPRWRGSWVNSLEYNEFTLTGIVNWFGGYDLSAEDETGPDTAGDCGLSPGYTPCRVDDYVTLDLTGQFQLNDQFTFYVNVLNVLDDLPPIDPVTYGAHLYNAVQGGTGIFGRAFRAGVRVDF
ncbi:TonB-dependent receptor [Sphingosinicella sp. LHD-64]|nr:TonB-dependent receptor [Sphingosinicella sp. LHD-64]MDQ8755422.1 TonB-dependent receptor [Sphingosinicella sp. LHD-64]